MENKIIVSNDRIISNYFNINISKGEDLLERKDKKIKDFIIKYKTFLFEETYDKFKQFFNNTGLFITRIYQKQNDYTKIYVDELGTLASHNNNYNIPVEKNYIFRSHLNIHIYVDDIIRIDDCIYGIINGEKKLIYQENKTYNSTLNDIKEIRKIIYDEELSLDNKINKINAITTYNAFPNLKYNEIKMIECIHPYYDILVLTNEGNLFINGRLYSENVREICKMTSCLSYIIYNNEVVETYTSVLDNCCIQSFKKVLCSNYGFIAMLNDQKYLFLQTLPCEEVWDYDFDNYIELKFANIDDFSYKINTDTEEATLVLTSNNTNITFSFDIYVWK